MTRKGGQRSRPSIQISLGRASRLHGLVTLLEAPGTGREVVLRELGVGLRTFYRELELLRRCGIQVRFEGKVYTLVGTAAEAEGLLPFPDPRLSFAEMAELARGESAVAQRLAAIYLQVVEPRAEAKPRGKRGAAKAKGRAKR